jgi:hypothetical protein
MNWRIEPEALVNATAEAFPFAGLDAPPSAREQAWSARLQEALLGMDAQDARGLDEWLAQRAASDEPHRDEARLVAAWDTLIRDAHGGSGAFDHWASMQAGHDQGADHGM